MDLQYAEESTTLAPSVSHFDLMSKHGSSLSDSASICSDTGFASGEDEFEIASERSLIGDSYEEYADASCADQSVDSSHFCAPNSIVSFDVYDQNLVCDYAEETGVDKAASVKDPSFVENELYFCDELRGVDGNGGLEILDCSTAESHVTSHAGFGELDGCNLESECNESILEDMVDKLYAEEVENDRDEIIHAQSDANSTKDEGEELGVDNGFHPGENGHKSIALVSGNGEELNGTGSGYVTDVNVDAFYLCANGEEELEVKNEIIELTELVEKKAGVVEEEDTSRIQKVTIASGVQLHLISKSIEDEQLNETGSGCVIDVNADAFCPCANGEEEFKVKDEIIKPTELVEKNSGFIEEEDTNLIQEITMSSGVQLHRSSKYNEGDQMNGTGSGCGTGVNVDAFCPCANGEEELEVKDEIIKLTELLEKDSGFLEDEDTNIIQEIAMSSGVQLNLSSKSIEVPEEDLDNECNVSESAEKCTVQAPGTHRTIQWDPLCLGNVNSSVRVFPSSLNEEHTDINDSITVTSKVQLDENSRKGEQLVTNIDNGFVGKTVDNCGESDLNYVASLDNCENGVQEPNSKNAILDLSNFNEDGSEIEACSGVICSQMNGNRSELLVSNDSVEVNSCKIEKIIDSEPDLGFKMASESNSTQEGNIVRERVTENENGGLDMNVFSTWRNEHDNSSCGDSLGKGDHEGSISDSEIDGMMFGSSEAANAFFEEFGREIHHSDEHSQLVDGQIISESDDEDGDEAEMFDSDALAAILKVANSSGSDGNTFILTSKDGSKLFSLDQGSGLASSLGSTPLINQSKQSKIENPTSEDSLTEEVKGQLESLHRLKVKYLKLVQKLGYSPEDSIAQQVLYRLALTGQYLSSDYAKWKAEKIEEDGGDSDVDLGISLDILVIGKTGVGKSATINSIFGESRVRTDAFEPSTSTVKEITGKVDGISIRVIDTPGLRASPFEQGFNNKALSSIKKSMKSHPPDIILYIDRMDTQFRDLSDLPLLRSINSFLGVSIWKSVIVTLTHAASEPPEGPSGSPISYDAFVSQRSRIAQQTVAQGIGNFNLMNVGLLNQVALVENHSCPKDGDGQKVLPNGQTWRTHLLLRCCSMKILSELGTLSNTKDQIENRKMFNLRLRSPNLPYLLSWLLQPRSHPKLTPGEDGDLDSNMYDMEEDGEDEYDQLPPFTPLRRSQIEMLSKEQRKAYFDEYDYRVKLFQSKQWKDELKRIHEVKNRDEEAGGIEESAYMGEYPDPTPANVPVALPDFALPLSFDSDNPAYRYRFLEPTGSQFLARPVFDTNGWDHDFGHHGVMLEQNMALLGHFPASISAQVTKDKDEFTVHLDSSVSAKHGTSGSSMIGFDIQDVGKRRAYIVRGETKLYCRKNKTAAGLSATFLGDSMTPGVKLENETLLGKRVALVSSAGTVRSHEDAVYGANLEVRLRETDFPVSQDQQHALGLSLVRWRGDLALSSNLVSQFPIGRASKMAVRLSLNHKRSGQIAIRTNSSEQLQIALLGIIPIAASILKSNAWTKILDISYLVS